MKSIKKAIIIVILIGLGIYGFNYLNLKMPSSKITNADERNSGISYDVHYDYHIMPSVLIYNLKKISVDKAAADVFRVFLQTSSALKEKKFDRVELAYKGKTKFMIRGDYFAEIGQEFGEQNPMFTIRTFPENLNNLNGESAYSEWSGGVLSVVGKQMEDFNDFTAKWYMDELIKQNTD